ncbi:MAG: AraC family transcriptional regulator [Paenibacillaceae bacterium]|nr:AraC family transcriptional regulator [Paenibacillaceae bacterium]
MKWKMIIADDEFNVRQGLQEVVDWGEMGIEVIALAANGQEAYEMCIAYQPDILLTDIRMPMLDGLEVAARLKEATPLMRIIIISGIQDFNYVKTALKLEADGYLLKPIKLEELAETVSQVVASMEAERSKKLQLERLELNLKESMPVLKEKFMVDLLTGLFKNGAEIRRKLDFFQMVLEEEASWKVALFQMDEYAKAVELYSEKYRNLLGFSVRNIMDDILSKVKTAVAVSLKEDEYAVLFPCSRLEEESIMELCQEIVHAINTYLKISISVGIGNRVGSLTDVHISCQEARSAVEYKFFTGKNSIVDIRDIGEARMELDLNAVYDGQMKVIQLMKLGDAGTVRLKVAEILQDLSSNRSIPAGYVQSICVEMVTLASKAYLELGEQLESAELSLPDMINGIYRQDHVHGLADMMQDFLERLTSHMAQRHSNKNAGTIRKIKDIITSRYMENLSVSLISEEIFLSPNYISLIFKKETGESITEFMTKVRIEAAKQLLQDRDLKVLDISEMVGYENATYFSTVFKKYTGLHPQKYRSLYPPE